MDNYDEDLTENKWYNTLCKKHQDLFLRATNERWMICIPRIGSWKSTIEDGDLFSQKSFETHILKPVMLYTGDSDSSSTYANNKYATYNGKEVVIQGSKILCIKGFSYNMNTPSYDKRNENLVLNIESCHTSTILFEETFFNENEESYPVLCISEPLEPHLVVSKKDSETTEELDQAVPKRKVYGSYLWKRANHPNRLKQQIDEKISQFVLHPLKFDDEYSNKFIDKEVKSLHDAVLSLLTACLHVSLRDNKLKKLCDVPTEKDNITSSLEEYVMYGINRSVGTYLNDVFAYHDSVLNKITRNLSTITLSDLGIKDIFWSSVPRARRELSRINQYRLAKEKITCLQNAIGCLSSKPKIVYSDQSPITTPVDQKSFVEAVAMTTCHGNTAMSTDDLLPLLVYLITTCDVANWLSNFCYLKRFHFAKSPLDKSGFYIATLEAALEHVRNGNVHLNKFSNSFKRQNSKDDLEQFFMALKNGEVDLVKRLLRQAEAMRSLQEHDKCHPLCECSKCQQLTEKKPSGGSRSIIGVNCRDEKGRTPLHIAALTGKHEMVEALISLGGDLNASDYHGATPLHLASQEGNQSAIFLLLHHGASPNSEDNNNNTPLHLACLGGHEGCVKALLFYDPVSTVVKVNAANDVGDTPLHVASKWGYVSIVTCLMEYGGDPHQTNKRKVTPLNISGTTRVSRALRYTEPSNVYYPTTSEKVTHHVKSSKASTKKPSRSYTVKAISNAQEDQVSKQVEKLLRAVGDDDINMVSYVCGWDVAPKPEHERCHPLCQCFKCQPPVQDVCLHANSANSEGVTPLLIAAKKGYFEMVVLLLKHGAKTNAKSKSKGHSPLHLAAQYGHEKIVRALLEARAACDVRDTEGNTPIYMCAMNGHYKCADLLLKAGASVNLRNHRGNSPLHVAVRWKQGATACLLIEKGALAYYENNDGQKATDLAKQDKEMTALLKKALEANDIFEGRNPISNDSFLPTNQSAKKLQRRKSLTQSEKDESLANEILTNQEKLKTPSTPPMVGVVMFETRNAVFDFEQTDSLNDSFLEALANSTSISENTTDTDNINQTQTQEPPQNVLFSSPQLSEKASNDYNLNSENFNDRSVNSGETNIGGSVSDPKHPSTNLHFPSEVPDPKESSERSSESCSSKQRGSYFEISPKADSSCMQKQLVLVKDLENFEAAKSSNQTVKEVSLKQDSEYLSFK